MTLKNKCKMHASELEDHVLEFVDNEIERVRNLTGYSPTVTAVVRKILNAGIQALTENKNA